MSSLRLDGQCAKLDKILPEYFFLLQFVVLEEFAKLGLQLFEVMVQTQYNLFQVLIVSLVGPGPSFELGIGFPQPFRRNLQLIDLLRTHFQRRFRFFIELVSLLICKRRKTVCCVRKVVVFLILQDLVDLAKRQVNAFRILQRKLVLCRYVLLKLIFLLLLPLSALLKLRITWGQLHNLLVKTL